MVLLWISTVVSPRWRYEELVVTVRVTLQPAKAARHAAKAVAITKRFIALIIALIILIRAEVPEVLLDGLVARLLLRFEVGYVGRDEAEVLLTQLHSAADSTKASACQGLSSELTGVLRVTDESPRRYNLLQSVLVDAALR